MSRLLLLNRILSELLSTVLPKIPPLRDLKKQLKSTIFIFVVLLMFVAGTVLGLFLTQVMSLIQTNTTISSGGYVKALGFGIYWDASLTDRVSSIDWSALEPGSTKNTVIYIRNEGNSPMNLSMSTLNWNPSTASRYITLTWDYLNQIINVSQAVQVTLTLRVDSKITGITNFSFDIVIMGSG